MTEGKKALKGLELAIPNFGSEMALVTLSSHVWVKLVNGSNLPKVAKKCQSPCVQKAEKGEYLVNGTMIS